ILETVRARLGWYEGEGPALRARARKVADPPRLSNALSGPTVALIAEVKRRSPSAGTISDDLDPVRQAGSFANAGASAVSVLTEERFFGGSPEDLRRISTTIEVPLLRKDFILHEAQIAEARLWGASGVLLIARALPAQRLRELLSCTADLGLEALVETHDMAELDMALSAGAGILGVNSRNLDTFAIDTHGAWQLLSSIPRDRIGVAESGMSERRDVELAAQAGADAVLIGTALSRASDPAGLAASLTGVERHGR
ncbi:MAG: indole-3-glycerol phosphate synthase TrpC, partial [Gemmatimonadales bacterium]